jgi:cysteine desulfurase/selenocysteine lyase
LLTPTARETDFPSLTERTYLNTAAEGISPGQVVAALGQYAQDRLLGMDGRLLHEAQWRQVRQRAARFFDLTMEEVGFCSCTSEAFNLAAMALRLQEGDEIVVNDLDFPATATPWMQADCAAVAKVWRARQGALRLEDLIALLGPRTRLVNVSLVSFYNGFKIQLEEIIEAVRQHSSALVAVDVTQALGRVPLNLKGADLIVSSTHKWILGSHGGGLVGVPAKRTQEWTTPAGGWYNIQDAFRSDRFDGPAQSKPGAESFMVGMPNYAAVYAVNAALAYIESVGVENIARHADPLVRQCLDGVKAMPIELLTPDEPGALGGIFSFLHPQAERLHQHLHEQNIHIMSQAGRLRVAIHGYNTQEDIEFFLKTLHEALTA